MLASLHHLSVLPAAVFLLGLVGSALGQESALFVTNSGAVGIGTETPGADLEITDVDGNAFTGYRLNNQAFAGTTWVFSAANNGSLQFNKIDSGGSEASFNSRLDGDGKSTLVVQGSVDATQFNVTSSRKLKTDFAALDSHDILKKLARLPVTSWRYKHEPKTTHHYGAVAEDFQAMFGLGNGKQISTVDATGVTMAAIKGLYEVVKEKNTEIAQLRSELAELRKLVQALTSMAIAK